MKHMRMQEQFLKMSGLLIIGIAVIVLLLIDSFQAISQLVVTESILTFNVIFISILIEANPFVLMGVFIVGIIRKSLKVKVLSQLLRKYFYF